MEWFDGVIGFSYLAMVMVVLVCSAIVIGTAREHREANECKAIQINGTCLYEKCLVEKEIGITVHERAYNQERYKLCIMERSSEILRGKQ